MNANTKSFLKNAILGLVGGGTLASLYALKNSKKELSGDPEFKENEIVVPLSRTNFLKAVRTESLGKSLPTSPSAESGSETAVNAEDLAGMSPKDLASLKKSLLRKKAGACSSKIKAVTTTSSAETPVRHVSGANSTFLRDKKGRFISEEDLKKSAGMLDDARGVIGDNLGMFGGFTAGLVLTKMISDKIMINKKKKLVEQSRKRYVDTLTREVNDSDLPYYSKSAEDRGIAGRTLGLLGLTGLAFSGAAAAVMYRIMENRRKETEKANDSDLAVYPAEKSIKFRFPKVQANN